MQPALKEVFDNALKLPIDMQSLLVEKLIGNVEAHIDPALERQHLAKAKRRRNEFRSGQVVAVDGASGLEQVRKVVEG